MNKGLYKALIILSMAGLCACQSTNTPPPKAAPMPNVQTEQLQTTQPESQKPKADPERKADIVPVIDFIDSRAFDIELSAHMRETPAQVIVAPTADIHLNNIPQRLDKWLAVVKETGGTVKAQTVQNNKLAFRGFFGALIDVVVALFEAVEEATMYGPAQHYNVLVTYHRKTGIIENIQFNLRKEP